LREEFPFLRGNILVMMTIWLVMNFDDWRAAH
jgi:hypothetical protein